MDNYGAELQAYALQYKLNKLGFDCENIDYPFYKNPEFRITKAGRSPFRIGLKNRIKEFLMRQFLRVKSYIGTAAERRRRERFQQFYQQTGHSSRRYLSIEELYRDKSKNYDVYIAGSDQIWNPRTPVSLAPYFLTFAPEGSRKISYASSFGVSSLAPEMFSQYNEWLKNLDAVSVRESSGADIVRAVSGREAEHVLDPTLLLDAEDWQNVMSVEAVPDYPYLLLYDLLSSREIVEFARKIAIQRKLKIIRICRSSWTPEEKGICNIADAGPAEFIGLFSSASFVVTNSFHGTVFSIIFKKEFYTVIPDIMSNSGRVASLLANVALTDRSIKASECSKVSGPGNDIDYAVVFEKLDNSRVRSLDFLIHAVEG